MSDGSGSLIWSPDLRLAGRGLGVVDTAILLPAADAMQAGSAAAVGVTWTGRHGLYRSSTVKIYLLNMRISMAAT